MTTWKTGKFVKTTTATVQRTRGKSFKAKQKQATNCETEVLRQLAWYYS